MPKSHKTAQDRLDMPSLGNRAEKERKEESERRRIHYIANRERIIARQKRYYAEHRKERNVYSKKYHEAHREELEAYQKEYRATHTEEQKGRNRAYYQAHHEELKARQREYNSAHVVEQREWKAEQRKAVWDELLRIYGASCSCCGTRTRYFLTIHHVHGRNEVEKGRANQFAVWKKAIQARDPKAYRILCFNCHLGGMHHNNGICPHAQRSSAKKSSAVKTVRSRY